MCQAEAASLQRAMNFRLHDRYSVILMSRRPNAPYADRIQENGKILIVKNGQHNPELVKVYEKIRQGIWVYNGTFQLLDAWPEKSNCLVVFKFRLELIEEQESIPRPRNFDHDRLIPSSVKLEVWKRDNGKCRMCGCADNLHFDDIIPFSKGGSSFDNVQLLCARHNLANRDRIE